MNRRSFVKAVGSFAGTLALSGMPDTAGATPIAPEGGANRYRISSLGRKPLAIAMWDFSWLQRHHRLGEFENWDRTLDELVDRGYNAIRMDCMPHLVAPDAQGQVTEEYLFVKESWKPTLWGNNYTVRVRPREALLEFLPKCYDRGIHVGLATWFHGPVKRFTTEDGLYMAWSGTLEFLKQHGMLEKVLYVDVLNEYPFWHGFQWLKQNLQNRADLQKYQAEHPDVHIPDMQDVGKAAKFNPLQKEFLNSYLTGQLKRLKAKWPDLDFFASLDSGMPLDVIDLSAFDALDYHIWFHHNPEVAKAGVSTIGSMANDNDFEKAYANLKSFWHQNRERMIEWMSGQMRSIAGCARKRGIPCGNTEGWGPIMWLDHPALDWEWVKECGDIGVDLALSNGYKFICTSNFTHPQFPGLWRDVRWHRRLTSRIRSGHSGA